MADVQRKVSLIFEANTDQARASINSLVQSLQKIQSTPANLVNAGSIEQASRAAQQLQKHIRDAVNADTGKLDLSRFAASMSSAGTTLSGLRASLSAIGPEGNAAFMGVMRSINAANSSSVRLTKSMRGFLDTMKNTVKWQLSSSLMHGFMGSIQTAFNYAKDLDKSLNDIRIVTGQSAEQMAKFAVEANRAAQELGVTTTRYTEAALIFYQQGLDSQAVKERTDAVIKMANVTGDAAKDVSSYMTAIWNNFDDGSKSLEYYADVITKLGAATAASSSEIAGGLEKFAAIADTIGLSYEYATSMLTTIVAKTRQSEDVVGTALKTILARVQGLSLGETLDDGTNMNKYSKALASVGVNIKDASGQLKDMDIILDELGAKWQTLSKDTQVALAQTVGGVRQYNQIISLMDNWDFFKENVNLAETSGGSLTEQADIYAESWEAASNRVKAAAQGVYDALLNEKVFIKLDNIFAGALKGVTGLIKGMGGMLPILSTIGSIMTAKFAKEMPVMLNNLKLNFMGLTGAADKQALILQQKNTANAAAAMAKASTPYEQAQYESIMRVSQMKEELIKKQHILNNEQKQAYEAAIQEEMAVRGVVEERIRLLSMQQEKGQAAKANIINNANLPQTLTRQQMQASGVTGLEDRVQTSDDFTSYEAQEMAMATYAKKVEEVTTKLEALATAEGRLTGAHNSLNSLLESPTGLMQYKDKAQTLKAHLEGLSGAFKGNEEGTKLLETALQKIGDKAELNEIDIVELTTALQQLLAVSKGAINGAAQATQAEADVLSKTLGVPRNLVNQFVQEQKKAGQDETNIPVSGNIPKPSVEWASGVQVATQAASGLMSAYSAVNAVISANTTLTDENATAMEKVGAVVGVLTTGLFTLSSVLSLIKTLRTFSLKQSIMEAGQSLATAGAKTLEAGANVGLSKAIALVQKATGNLMMTNPIGWILGLIAILATVTVAIVHFANKTSEAEKKIDTLTKRIKTYDATLEKLKSTMDEFKGSWDEYETARNYLDECTEGTEEWNEALQKCNQSVLNLLASAPELAQYVRYNPDGSMYIAPEHLEEYERGLEDSTRATEATKLIDANELERTKIETSKVFLGDTTRLHSVSKFIQDNENKLSQWNKLSTNEQLDLRQELLEIFEGDSELVQQFLDESGIVDNLGESFLQSFMARWSESAIKHEALGRSSDIAYSSIFGGREGFDASNQKGYGREFEREVSSREKHYRDKTDTELRELMASTYGGIADDYKDLDAATMQHQLAIESVTSDLEFMSGTIQKVNKDIAGMSDIGRSIYRTGGLSQAKLSDLRYVGGNPDQHMLAETAKVLQEYFAGNYAEGTTYQYKQKYSQETLTALANFLGINIDDDTDLYGIDFWKVLENTLTNESYNPLAGFNLNTAENRDELIRIFGKSPEAYSDSDADAKRLAEEIGLSAEEISNWNDLINIYNQKVEENAIAGLSIIGSSGDYRFKANNLIIDEDTGKLIHRGGQQPTLGENFLLRMGEAGATVQDLDYFVKDVLNPIISNLSSKDLDALTGTIADLTEAGVPAADVMLAVSKILEGIQSKGRNLSEEEINAILEESGISVATWGNEIYNVTGLLYNATSATGAFSKSVEELIGELSAVNDLEALKRGEVLDDKAYAELEKLIPDIGNYFMRGLEGYIFKGTEEDAKRLAQIGEANAFRGEQRKAEINEVGQKAFGDNDFGLFSDPENFATNYRKWFAKGLNPEALAFFSMVGMDQSMIEALGGYTAGPIYNGLGELSGRFKEYLSLKGINETNFEKWFIESENQARSQIRGDNTPLSNEEINDLYLGQYSSSELSAQRDSLIAQGYNPDNIDFMAAQKYREEIEAYGLDGEEIASMAKHLSELDKYTGKTEYELMKIATAQTRWNRSIETGRSNLDDWEKKIKTATEDGLGEYSDAIGEVDKAYSDLLNLDYDSLSTNFLTDPEKLKLYKKILEGDTEALEEFKKAAADDIYKGEDYLDFKDRNGKLVGVSEEEMDKTIASINQIIEDNRLDIEIGADTSEARAQVNSLLSDLSFGSWESANEARAALSTIGVDADIVPKTVQVPEKTYKITTTGTRNGEEVNETAEVTTQAHEETYYVLQGKGFNSNATSPTVPKKSGGGGGGSKPTATKKTDGDKERYHTINNQLEDLTHNYDKIAKAADRAFGADRIKMLQKQEKAVKDLAAAQRTYLKEIEAYYEIDKADLAKASQLAGIEFILDENGTITNFDAIQDRMWEKYNSHIDSQGNVIDMDDKQWKKWEAKWQEVFDIIEQYEETQDLHKEALEQLQDYVNEIYDLQLETITYAVEVNIDSSELSLKILDQLLKRVEDSAWDAAEAIAFMGDKAGQFLDQNNTYRTAIRDILDNHTKDIYDSNGNLLQSATLTPEDIEKFLAGDQAVIEKIAEIGKQGGFTAEEIDRLKEYHESLLDISDKLTDLREDVFKTITDAFKNFNDELGEGIEKLEHFKEIVSSYKNIVGVVGKENLQVSNALLEGLAQTEVEQSIAILRSARERRDMIASEIDATEAKLQIAKEQGLEEDVKLWEETLKEMYEGLYDAEKEFMSSWEDTMETINETFKLTVKNIAEEFSQMVSGPLVKNLTLLQDAFDRQKDLDSLHLADYEKIYELSKLTRDITNSIDETDSVATKQALAKLQEEIYTLEASGAQVSQYQVENLRRIYELRLAEASLMEAQNAKSQVQMRRDNNGNWNYVYTADSEAVAEAEQNYEDKLYEIQRANAEYINEMEGLLIQAQIELTEKIEEIAEDETLSMEEKYRLIDEYTEYYTVKFNEYSDELGFVLGNNKTLYEEDWMKYSEATGYKISANEDYVDSFNETTYSIITGFDSLSEIQLAFATGTQNLMIEISEAFKDWAVNVDDAMTNAGSSVSEFGSTVREEMESAKEKTEEVKNSVIELADEMNTKFGEIIDGVENWEKTYSDTLDRAIAKNTQLASSFSELLKLLSAYETKKEENENKSSFSSNNGSIIGAGATGAIGDKDGGGGEPSKPQGPETGEVRVEYVVSPSGAGNPTGPTILKGGEIGNISPNPAPGYKYDTFTIKTGKDILQGISTTKIKAIDGKTGKATVKLYYQKVESSNYTSPSYNVNRLEHIQALNPSVGFDTGGYTGTWGTSGRMAVLHEKELVLNKEDTKNILSSVGLIRKIAEVIDLNAFASAGFNSSIHNSSYGNIGSSMEQNVHITAEFPNATDKNEIYAAFGELVNLASQYANKK